jgi:CO/xanthine dehydrogenase Mo-binding subunit
MTTWTPAPSSSVRREDEALLRGRGTFIDGLRVPELEGACYAAFVRSTIAHATITSIDITEAAISTCGPYRPVCP